MYSTFNNACGIIYLEVKNSSSKLFYQVSTFTYGLKQAESQRLLHGVQNYPGTELSKKRKASIKLHLCCMRRIGESVIGLPYVAKAVRLLDLPGKVYVLLKTCAAE